MQLPGGSSGIRGVRFEVYPDAPCMEYLEVSINGGTPNGWFIVENPTKMGCFGGTPISGNLHLAT